MRCNVLLSVSSNDSRAFGHQWWFIERYRRQSTCTKKTLRWLWHLLQIVELAHSQLNLLLHVIWNVSTAAEETRTVVFLVCFEFFSHSWVSTWPLIASTWMCILNSEKRAPLIAEANPQASRTYYIRCTSCKVDDNFAWHIIVARTVNFNNNNRHKPYARFVCFMTQQRHQSHTHARGDQPFTLIILSHHLSALRPFHLVSKTRHTIFALKTRRTHAELVILFNNLNNMALLTG